MQKLTILLATVCTVFIFFACANETVSSVQLEMRPMIKSHCVNDNQCATFQIVFPQFTGGDSAAVYNVNSTVQGFIMNMVGASTSQPFEVAIDAAGASYCEAFLNAKRQDLNMMGSRNLNVTSNVLVNNPKIISVEITYANSIGDQIDVVSRRATFDMKQKGKFLRLNDLVNPADSLQLSNLLEKAYKASKGKMPSARIADVLYPGMTKLPVSQNVFVVPEGLRFYYQQSEVAPPNLGSSDFILTWAELGDMVDKKNWF